MIHAWAYLSVSLLWLASTSAMDDGGSAQSVLQFDDASRVGEHKLEWRAAVSETWNVLGPFPIHAREQHFLSPSFPLNLSDPIDFTARWPSSYADGGSVGWTTTHSKADCTLDVSFPDIRWSSLRATEGWAALQHHIVLHTTITVEPPSNLSWESDEPPRLLVDLSQGSFFTVLPAKGAGESADIVPQWYMGNIYAMERVQPHTILLPSSLSRTGPTTYDLFVSGDYEIRLFGDPLFSGDKSGVPVLSVALTVNLEAEPAEDTVQLVPTHDVACDFVDGWAFGEALGVGVHSVSGWWTVEGVSLASNELLDRLTLTRVQNIALAPTQTRIIPIKLSQSLPFGSREIPISLHLTSRSNVSKTLHTTLAVAQHPHWSPSEVPNAGIKATYFYGTSMPTAFVVIPPEDPNNGPPRPPVLALHGAGVDILSMPFWVQALPRQKHSWTVAPTGRTAWGLDWHGPSAMDVWGSVDALYEILKSRDAWRGYELAERTRVLMIGHSNGGYGAWWNAERHPDRVVAVIPAAGYIKSQAYVPLIQSHSAHYVDPSLRAILETALTPDDNDLFLSNLAHIPILAIHGGDDENVPTWHTREYVSTLKAWNPLANVTLREDRGEPHWYPSVFENDNVRQFMHSVLESKAASAILQPLGVEGTFTLTVSIPAESGPLHGWRIHKLLVPGRLARLTVSVSGASINVETTNVEAFSIQHIRQSSTDALFLDGNTMPMSNIRVDDSGIVYLTCDNGSWRQQSLGGSVSRDPQPSGHLSTILTSKAPLIIVYTAGSLSSLSAALRIAHALDAYHKLDTEIIDEAEAVHRLHTSTFGEGNIVVVSIGAGPFTNALLGQRRTPFALEQDCLLLRGRHLRKQSTTLFLHPHPIALDASVLFAHWEDANALERALRLFPIRTGVPIPDWVVTTGKADQLGAAGIEAAGVWGNGWTWNGAMSSF